MQHKENIMYNRFSIARKNLDYSSPLD